jgi:hypothetical protein
VYLDQIWHGGDDIEDYLDSTLFTHADSILKWRSFKFLRWVQILKPMVDLDEILYGGDGIEYYIGSILLNPVT